VRLYPIDALFWNGYNLRLSRNKPACRDYTRYLDTLNSQRRLDEIRRFHSLDYGAKRERILTLTNCDTN
jgi:hypothetical protein